MTLRNLTRDQVQAVVMAAKQATHFRPNPTNGWFVISKIDDSCSFDKQTIEVEVGATEYRIYTIADLNYSAIGFDKRVPVNLPPIHRLSPMIESLGKNLAKYKDLVNSGMDNAHTYKETFGGIYTSFLIKVGVTEASSVLKKHEWLIDAGCNPMTAALILHLENLSRASIFYNEGNYQGLHTQVINMDYWKYLFLSIELVLKDLDGIVSEIQPVKD